MAETATVGLNLTGDFAEQAEASADAADKLGAALDMVTRQRPWTSSDALKVMEASAKTSYDAMVEGAKKAKAAQDALMRSLRDSAKASSAKGSFGEGWMNRTPTSLQGTPPAASAFQKVIQGLGNTLGPKAASVALNAAGVLSENAGLLKLGGAALSVGGGIVAGAAKLTLTAAAALAAAGVAVGAAVIKLGVEETSRREAQELILKKLGGSYALPVQLAARFGLDQGEAVIKVKQLLASHFDAAQIKQLVKIDVGIAAVLGPEKAKAFLDKMAMMVKKGSKATEEAMAGFAEAGIDTTKAWQILATKLGVSVAIAKGKVKAGAVEMKVALDAVKQAAEQDFGGIATAMGNSVPAKLLHLKSLFFGLFDSMDLGPLKGFLDNLIGALSGGAGAELKGALKELFSAISHTLFDPFQGGTGKKKMEDMLRGLAAVVREVAGSVREAAPVVLMLVDAMASLGREAQAGSVEWATFKGALYGVFSPILDPLVQAYNLLRLLAAAFGYASDSASTAGSSMSQAGNDIGGNLGLGVINGISSAVGGVIEAAGSMGNAAADALRAALGVASPAKVGIFVGQMLGAGVAQGAENDNGVSAAGASIADRAMGGMGGALGGGAVGGAGAAGGSVTINITLPPGSPAETQAAAKAGAEEAFRAWQAYQRRDARERAA